MKHVDLETPTPLLDQVYLGCAPRECKPTQSLVAECRMFESPTSAGTNETLPGSGEVNANIAALSHDMEGHVMKCVEWYCELTNENVEQLYQVSASCIDDHQFKKQELGAVGELSNVCSPIVLKCLYVARIGRPDILWSVNKVARPVAKCTSACDTRLAFFIS